MQLAGELAKMNLASLIRLVRNGELTGKVCLTQGVNTAFIFFDSGQPIHVESDAGSGREALLELFLWQSGSFSYIESEVDDVSRSLNPDEPLEKLLKEGLAYQEALRFLEQLRISPRTVFRAAESGNGPLLSMMDGRKNISEIVSLLGLSKSEYAIELKELVAQGKALVHEPKATTDGIVLPDWVISRLKQDNPNPSQAIVDLIIWVDRIKCWLYQADVDLDRVIAGLESGKSALEKLEDPVCLGVGASAAESNQGSFQDQDSAPAALSSDLHSGSSQLDYGDESGTAGADTDFESSQNRPGPPSYEF